MAQRAPTRGAPTNRFDPFRWSSMMSGPSNFGNNPVDIQSMVGRAMALHQSGQLGEAERLYKSVLASHPNHFEALHYLGLLEAQRGRFEDADRLMGRSLKVNDRAVEAYANHARVLNALKRSKDAIAACDRALSLNPRSIE